MKDDLRELLRVKQLSPNTATNKPSTRCPACGDTVVYDLCGANINDLHYQGNHIAGLRVCPGINCRSLLFVIYSVAPGQKFNIDTSYPPVRIDFDQTEIPPKVLNVFEEALECHANQCYFAAAVMVRKTLEVICDDQEAKGENLFKSIEKLKEKIIIAPALLDGMHDLRHLGADAAHVDLKTFDGVGSEEVEVAIALTKEILKAVYQSDSILKKLNALKSKNSTT